MPRGGASRLVSIPSSFREMGDAGSPITERKPSQQLIE
jgi:hypothetical protein